MLVHVWVCHLCQITHLSQVVHLSQITHLSQVMRLSQILHLSQFSLDDINQVYFDWKKSIKSILIGRNVSSQF